MYCLDLLEAASDALGYKRYFDDKYLPYSKILLAWLG